MPEHVALSFLGLSDYSTTTYAWEDEEHTTQYIQQAIRTFFDVDRLFIAMTPGAREKHETELETRLSFDRIDIPTGVNEREWWDVFEAIADTVPESARLTIDITHGFRSQPLVALAVALYLEAARDVDVARIVYGAYDENGASDTTEILNLTSFLSIIEWSVAARQFLRDGSAESLAALMNEIHGAAYRQGAEVKPKHASTAASQLEALTTALSVVRPREVVEKRTASMIEAIDRVQDDIERLPQLRPLSVLLDQIQARIEPMQASSLFDEQGFHAQAEMMRFFLKTDQLQQAVTLAREAMISHQALKIGHSPEPVSRDEEGGRQKAEERLNSLIRTGTADRSAEEDKLADLWARLIDVRNDINHAGMNADPDSGSNLASRAGTVVEAVADHVTTESNGSIRDVRIKSSQAN